MKYKLHTELRSKLLHLEDINNIETDFLIEQLGLVVTKTILQELEDKRKVIHNYLSYIGSVLSQKLATNDEKKSDLGLHAKNNVSKSSFDGLTKEITKGSMIGLTHAGIISITRRNKDFTVERVYANNKSKGISI